MKANMFLSCCFLFYVALANRTAAQVNVVRPGDPIILVNGVSDDATAGPPPALEGVEHAIDGITQKYLNFLDLGSGFIVTPSAGPTLVNGLRFYTANDAVERDPASYVLEGSISGSGGPWTMISSGSLNLPLGRNASGPAPGIPVNPAVHSNQVVNFFNAARYTSYRVTFPTLRNVAAANSMQIGEVELLSTASHLSATKQGGGLLINGFGIQTSQIALEGSADLVNWVRLGYPPVNLNGEFQFVELDISAPPVRFYRLKGEFPSGLVTWWRGENHYLDSFGTNHGSAFSNAGPSFIAGVRGQALSFNGTNEGMFIGSAPIPSPWTACFWVKRHDAPEASAALLTDVAGGLKMEQWNFTRQVGFTAFGVADYNFTYSVPTNVWTHLTFVSTAGSTILYANGAPVETNAATINLPMNVLGVRETGQDHLHGALDETMLFNRALSSPEIQQVIETTRGPQFPAGLVTWWRGENDYLDSFGTNHGSAFSNAGPTFVAGQRGQALSFNGTNEGMFIGSAPIPSPWTACFWVKRHDAPEASAALLTDVAGGLKMEQWNFTRQVGFTAFGVADYNFTYSVPTNVWTHLSFVSNAGSTILYANGIAVETNAATINLPMNILGVRETGQDHFHGLLDETALFNRALSPQEIQQVVSETRGP